jgi:hypothetical protein
VHLVDIMFIMNNREAELEVVRQAKMDKCFLVG